MVVAARLSNLGGTWRSTPGINSNYPTSTYADVYSESTQFDGIFNIILQKQSPDYTAPGVSVGNVAKNQVAIVSYDTSASRLSLTTTAQDIPFNRVHGLDTSIVTSLSNGKFKLQAGTYDIGWFAQHRITPSSAAIMRTYLFNVTDGVEVDSGSLNGGATPTVVDMMGSSIGSSAITITSEKEFAIRAINLSGTGSNYIGDNISSPFSLKAQVKITKLNGQ